MKTIIRLSCLLLIIPFLIVSITSCGRIDFGIKDSMLSKITDSYEEDNFEKVTSTLKSKYENIKVYADASSDSDKNEADLQDTNDNNINSNTNTSTDRADNTDIVDTANQTSNSNSNHSNNSGDENPQTLNKGDDLNNTDNIDDADDVENTDVIDNTDNVNDANNIGDADNTNNAGNVDNTGNIDNAGNVDSKENSDNTGDVDSTVIGDNNDSADDIVNDDHIDNTDSIDGDDIEDDDIEDDEYVSKTELFVYDLIFNELSIYYDVFTAVITLSNGKVVHGIGYTDYSEAYKLEDGSKTLFSSGFIAFCDQPYISQRMYESGLEIERLEDDDDKYGFIYAFSREPFTSHLVVFDKYITYGVDEESQIFYTETEYDKDYLRKNFNTALGTLYSYDENRVLNDFSFGKYLPLGGISVSDEIDFRGLEAEINRIIEEQNLKFSTVDIQTAVYIAQDALNSYLLSLQEETFLGYNVKELVEISKQIDPMSCIRITADGLELVDIQPTPPRTASGLMKWLTALGAVAAVAGGVVLSIYGMPHLAGAVIGSAIEVFTEVVIENKTLENVDWRKVAIAAVAGAISANLGLFGDSVVGGATNATFTLIDGGSLGDVANDFAIGTAAGLALGGAFNMVGKGISKLASKLPNPPKVIKISTLDDAIDLDGKLANKLDDPVTDAASYQAKKQAQNLLDSQAKASKDELYKVLGLGDDFTSPDDLQQVLSKFKDNTVPKIDLGNESTLYDNLYGRYKFDVNGQPYRIRIEIHSDKLDFNGVKSPYHTKPHYHIERRSKGMTGGWVSQYTGFLEDLFK